MSTPEVKIFFVGDEVTAIIGGQRYEGVIDEFEYDIASIILGAERTTAVVRLTRPCGRLEAGATTPVFVADLEVVTS